MHRSIWVHSNTGIQGMILRTVTYWELLWVLRRDVQLFRRKAGILRLEHKWKSTCNKLTHASTLGATNSSVCKVSPLYMASWGVQWPVPNQEQHKKHFIPPATNPSLPPGSCFGYSNSVTQREVYEGLGEKASTLNCHLCIFHIFRENISSFLPSLPLTLPLTSQNAT